jgi:Putative Actinobacterial Holin-X, holin superfamily III
MADQATMKTNGPASASATASGRLGAVPTAGGGANDVGPGDVVTNVAEFAEHLLTLAELQTRLSAIELKQNVQAVKFGSAVMLVGAVIGVAGLPIALAGIAEVLVSTLGLSRGAALLSVAVAAFAVAGACIAIAASRLSGADLGFPLSKEELTRNINWIRTVLLYSGRSSRGLRR